MILKTSGHAECDIFAELHILNGLQEHSATAKQDGMKRRQYEANDVMRHPQREAAHYILPLETQYCPILLINWDVKSPQNTNFKQSSLEAT